MYFCGRHFNKTSFPLCQRAYTLGKFYSPQALSTFMKKFLPVIVIAAIAVSTEKNA